MSKLAQATVSRGGWAPLPWLSKDDRAAADRRWADRSYAHRTDEDKQCGGCRYFAATGMDFGLCANPASEMDGLVTFEHGGCGSHSELQHEAAAAMERAVGE